MKRALSDALRARIGTLTSGLHAELVEIAQRAFEEGAVCERRDLAAFCEARLNDLERDTAEVAPEIRRTLETRSIDTASAESMLAHLGATVLAFEAVQCEIARRSRDDGPDCGDEG